MLILSLLIKEVNWIHYALSDKNNDWEPLLKLSIFCQDLCNPSTQVKSFANIESFYSWKVSLNFKDLPCIFVLKFWGI